MELKSHHDGKLLNKWLKFKHLSQEEFGKKIGRTRAMVSKYTKQAEFELDIRLLVLHGLDLDVQEFYNFDPDQPQDGSYYPDDTADPSLENYEKLKEIIIQLELENLELKKIIQRLE